jgi:hypothetical protein
MGGQTSPFNTADEIIKERTNMNDKPKGLIKTVLAGKITLPFITLGLTADKKQFELTGNRGPVLGIHQPLYYSIGGPVYINTSFQGWVQVGRLFEPEETWQTLSKERVDEWRAAQKPYSKEAPDYPPYEVTTKRKDYPTLNKIYGRYKALFFAAKFNLKDQCKGFTFPTRALFIREKFIVIPWVEKNGKYHARPIYSMDPKAYIEMSEELRKKDFEALYEKYNGVIEE